MYTPEHLMVRIIAGQGHALHQFRQLRRNDLTYCDNQRLLQLLCQHHDWSFLHPLFLVSEVRDAFQHRPEYLPKQFYRLIARAFQAKNLGAVCLLVLDRELLTVLTERKLITSTIFNDVFYQSAVRDEFEEIMLDTIRGVMHADGFEIPDVLAVQKHIILATNYLQFAETQNPIALYYRTQRLYNEEEATVETSASIVKLMSGHRSIFDGRCYYGLARNQSVVLANKLARTKTPCDFATVSSSEYFDTMKLAANMHHAEAQWHLAQLYQRFDRLTDAMLYLEAAAAQNYAPAKQYYEQMLSEGQLDEVTLQRDIERIRFFFHPHHRAPSSVRSPVACVPLDLGSPTSSNVDWR